VPAAHCSTATTALRCRGYPLSRPDVARRMPSGKPRLSGPWHRFRTYVSAAQSPLGRRCWVQPLVVLPTETGSSPQQPDSELHIALAQRQHFTALRLFRSSGLTQQVLQGHFSTARVNLPGPSLVQKNNNEKTLATTSAFHSLQPLHSKELERVTVSQCRAELD